MKTLLIGLKKRLSIKNIAQAKFFMSALIMLFSLGATAQSITLPAVKIQNLEAFKGQYISVYFATGTPATIGLTPEQISLREIRAKVSFAITNSVEMVDKMTVAISGFSIPYNVLLVVIHNQPNFSWINANGSFPLGEQESQNHRAMVIRSFLKTETDQLIRDGVIYLSL